MRMLLLVVTMLLAPAVQAAPVFADPRDLLEYAYEPYRDGDPPEDQFELWAPALLERWALAAARTPEDEVGAVDFDPMVNAQDYDLEAFRIGEPMVLGNHAVVIASFHNFSMPQRLRFTLVNGVAGWKIADIEALTPGSEWLLSELLATALE